MTLRYAGYYILLLLDYFAFQKHYVKFVVFRCEYYNYCSVIINSLRIKGKEMYAYFYGKVADIYSDRIILETNNIGYNIYMPGSDIAALRIGDETKVYTYTAVREDAFMLYGFGDSERLSLFKQLLQVNGVGPKAAMSILSNSSAEDLYMAILAGDSKALSKVPGIGAKTAARIILDLKDKVSPESIIGTGQSMSVGVHASATSVKAEAIEALKSLGYGASECLKAINTIEGIDSMTAEEVIRAVLIMM